jgi:hypothetical protein
VSFARAARPGALPRRPDASPEISVKFFYVRTRAIVPAVCGTNVTFGYPLRKTGETAGNVTVSLNWTMGFSVSEP